MPGIVHCNPELLYDAHLLPNLGVKKQMRVLSMLCSLLLLIACASNSSTDPKAETPAESKYSSSLPSMDNADTASRQSPADKGYSREFVLEEEVVENARSAINDMEPRDGSRFDAPAEADLPPLDQTFTLQLAAFRNMEQAVDYAQRYQIEEQQAGVAKILSKGELWYVLAYGIYVSREDANRAKLDLQSRGVPEPWIRTIATLEELANEAKASGY